MASLSTASRRPVDLMTSPMRAGSTSRAASPDATPAAAPSGWTTTACIHLSMVSSGKASGTGLLREEPSPGDRTRLRRLLADDGESRDLRVPFVERGDPAE